MRSRKAEKPTIFPCYQRGKGEKKKRREGEKEEKKGREEEGQEEETVWMFKYDIFFYGNL
jgi:hypothetical protein